MVFAGFVLNYDLLTSDILSPYVFLDALLTSFTDRRWLGACVCDGLSVFFLGLSLRAAMRVSLSLSSPEEA